MPRAVLDPNVLVSALLSPGGPSAQLLREFDAGAYEIITSPLLLTELRDVLRRDKFRRYLSEAEGDAYVEHLRVATVVANDPPASDRALSRDPDDEYLITLARGAAASALVSGDPHLTRLRDRGIPVFTPREFLDSLR